MRPAITPLFALFLIAGLPLSVGADDNSAMANCPHGNEAVTLPAPVDLTHLIETVTKLRNALGSPLIENSPSLTDDIRTVFDTSQIKTKMEQFYRLLYVIAQKAPKPASGPLELDAPSVRSVLVEAKVFTDQTIPSRISNVKLFLKNRDMPRYEITFSEAKTEVALNKGEGFFLYRNGKCQHAKKLIFNRTFSAALRMNHKRNIEVDEFKGVDLYGDFGNRGVIDVDIQYVALTSAEFFKGTNLGRVTAYVSSEEFKKNDHSFLLKMITKIVPDRSVQPIDW